MNKTTRSMVFAAFYVALAVALSYINKLFPIIQMPNGGSIELSVIAIFMASYHMGWKWGIGVGLGSWLIGVLFGLNDYIVSPMQTFLDYIAPVLAIGIASLFPKLFKLSNVYVGIVGGMFLKYASHVLAGVYFWFPEGEAAGSLAAWIYSAWTYNLAYNLATLIAAIIIVPLLIARIRKVPSVKFEGIKEN